MTRGLDATDQYLARETPAAGSNPPTLLLRPIVQIDGDAISFETLRPALIEAAGGRILEEAALDLLLQREALRRGISITSNQLQAERDLVLQTMTGTGIASGSAEAGRLLERMRIARGLGETRFESLLRRNATLRALVAPDVVITPLTMEQAYELRYGERRLARLIVTTTASEATRVLERLRAGEDFSALAAAVSTDSSAIRGGVLEPISLGDPSYPAAIRGALRNLTPGSLSSPIALEQSYAILRLDEIVAPLAAPPRPEDVLERLELDVRLQQERLLMNQLARRLLNEARIVVFDSAFDRAWRDRTQGSVIGE